MSVRDIVYHTRWTNNDEHVGARIVASATATAKRGYACVCVGENVYGDATIQV